jgi:hypothetical protein
MPLRCIAIIGVISAAAHCQANTASANDVAVAPSGSPAIAESLNLPPQIINFVAQRVGGSTCVVSGTIIDDNLEAVVIQLGGYLQGMTLYPAADGSFIYTFSLPPGQFAYIAALAFAEDDGTYSDPAETVITH